MTDGKDNTGSILGLRHLALRVTDIRRSRTFYETYFGMKAVWEPDAGSVYLSSGVDNLALHQMSEEEEKSFRAGGVHPLDHLGFIVDSPQTVRKLEKKVKESGERIVKPYKDHRDGSSSFYFSDPDNNVIQILFEPNISPKKI